MIRWTDMLTRATYTVDGPAVMEIQHHLATKLRDYLGDHFKKSGRPVQRLTQDPTTLKLLADCVASFWAERYPQLIYPIRVAVDPDRSHSVISPLELRPTDHVHHLTGPWRDDFLKPGAPPLLPAKALGLSAPFTLLAGEWALTASAYAICAWHLGQSNDSEREVHGDLAALRLGILLFPVWNALLRAGDPLRTLADHPTIRAVATHLTGSPDDALPDAWKPILSAIRTSTPAELQRNHVWLLVGSFYRIQQYVFESPMLPQIRGASILLEEAVQEAARRVSDAFGPECVIRQAGASVIALLPVDTAEAVRTWEEQITALAYRITGSARFAAGSAPVPLSSLLSGGRAFGVSQQQAYRALERRRDEAVEPVWETLPFEARCERCGQRAAETAQPGPDDTVVAMCRICQQREKVGRRKRRELIERAWRTVDFDPSHWVSPQEYEAGTPGDPVPPSLEELVPENRRRRWIAMVYGDGNNFGGIVQRLGGLADYLHWTRRLYWTVQALTQLALVTSTAFFAEPGSNEILSERPGSPGVRTRYTHYPYEILTLGGDDVAFFAWAPVGLKAVEQLQASLQHEFALASDGGGKPNDAARPNLPPVTFSFGVAISHHHLPVRRFMEIAEDVLLKAVKAMRRGDEREGRIAFFAEANIGEMTPQRVRELWRMKKQTVNGGTILLSLQPLTARELAFLLDKALSLTHHVGRLTRLTTPFITADPAIAALNYRYTAARATRRDGSDRPAGDDFFSSLEGETRMGETWTLFTGENSTGGQGTATLPWFKPKPGVAGEETKSGQLRAVPLLDLLQLCKVMQ